MSLCPAVAVALNVCPNPDDPAIVRPVRTGKASSTIEVPALVADADPPVLLAVAITRILAFSVDSVGI